MSNLTKLLYINNIPKDFVLLKKLMLVSQQIEFKGMQLDISSDEDNTNTFMVLKDNYDAKYSIGDIVLLNNLHDMHKITYPFSLLFEENITTNQTTQNAYIQSKELIEYVNKYKNIFQCIEQDLYIVNTKNIVAKLKLIE